MKWRGGHLRLFALPKHPGHQSEDVAGAVRHRNRFAIADGASSSYHPRGWACRLVRDFLRDPNPSPAWLQRAQARFQRELAPGLTDRFHRRAAERGSFATLLGFTLQPSGVDVSAVGDSLLVIAHPDGLWLAPALSAEDFAADPRLLCSHSGRGAFQGTAADFLAASRSWRTGPSGWEGVRLLAMTDALAAWLLAEDAPARLAQLWALPDQARFAALVAEEQAARRMRQDDTTLLLLDPR